MSDETHPTDEPVRQDDGSARSRRLWPWAAAAAAVGFVIGVMLPGGGPSGDSAGPSGDSANDGGQAATVEDGPAGQSPRVSAPSAPQPAESEAESGGHAAATEADGDHGGGEHEHGLAPGGWRQAAEGFGQTFTDTSLGQQAWFDAVSSWMTPAQAAKYEQVPVANIPTGQLVDAAVTDPGGALYTAGQLTYDTGLELEIGLSYDANESSWLVATVTPAKRPPR